MAKNGTVAKGANDGKDKALELLTEFASECHPLENDQQLLLLMDERTSAWYCECHIFGSRIIALGTTDVPLDPEDQPEYKANRDIDETSIAFQKMKEDARQKRSFSNIVAEWKRGQSDEDGIIDLAESPLKIIGGQHRFEAIRYALEHQVDVYHGVKVYFALDMTQRLDVQLISNTNINISGDLIDRMLETSKGVDLRLWCQNVGLLEKGQQFADAYARGGPISVRIARTFIANYFLGSALDTNSFNQVATTPVLFKSGNSENEWQEVKTSHPDLWSNQGLAQAGAEFAALIKAQRDAFSKKEKPKIDQPEKALNLAVIAAWAFVAGVLRNNAPRLERHFALKNKTNKDPLNADELAKGRHVLTDDPAYRGLGYRTDPQERGRFAELFFLQAENGKGITKSAIDIAIKQYHAKQGQLAVAEAKAKAGIT